MILAVMVAPGSCICVVTDSELTFLGIGDRRRCGENADVWVALWNLVSTKSLRLTGKWVKAHLLEKPELRAKYPTACVDVFGNACADQLAERAAIPAQVPDTVAKTVLSWQARTLAIQKRMVAILMHLVVEFPRATRPSVRRPFVCPLERAACESEHMVVLRKHGASCATCLQGCADGLDAQRLWLSTPCLGHAIPLDSMEARPVPVPLSPDFPTYMSGRVVHCSHAVFVFKGLAFCTQCGCFGAWRVKNLVLACAGITKYGTNSLRRILAGNPPEVS